MPIEAMDSECSIENKSVTKLSPGLVDDDETLARHIYSPIHIDRETGAATPAAFSDATDGMSVDRMSHTTVQEIVDRGEEKAANDRENGKEREFQGFIEVACREVRGVVNENGRAFCVYDSAKTYNIAHADIHQVESPRAMSRGARRALMKAFSKTPRRS